MRQGTHSFRHPSHVSHVRFSINFDTLHPFGTRSLFHVHRDPTDFPTNFNIFFCFLSLTAISMPPNGFFYVVLRYGIII